MPDLGPDVPKTTEYVILVHGTFAANEGDISAVDGMDRWWQKHSEFSKNLEKELNKSVPPPKFKYCVAPLLPFHEDLRPWWAKPFFRIAAPILGVFHWSGANTESARRQAGKRLFDYLEVLENPTRAKDEPPFYHLVAHSHGGVVVWEMLCEAERRDTSLNHLKSWTTVGTPFLRFRVDWLTCLLFPLVGLALLILIFVRQFPWWTDFWRQMAESPAHPWLVSAAYTWVYASIAALSLVARLFWSAYCQSLADRKASPIRFQLESWDLYSSLLATISLAAILAALAWGLHMAKPILFDEVLAFSKWRRCQPFLGVVWLVSALALGTICVARIATAVWIYALSPSETDIQDRTWKRWKDKYLAASAWAATMDEAINMLRALRRPIRGPLLPRFESPRADRYTHRLNQPRNPEKEQLNQRFFPWLLQFLLLPFALIWHWIIQPVYNELVAGLIDDFVLDRIRRNAIGEDLLGLRLREVSVHPRYEIPPSKPTDDTLFHAMDIRVGMQAGTFLNSIRHLIGQPWTGGIGFQRFFKGAMAGKPVESPLMTADAKVITAAADVLVHTNYFVLDEVRNEVIKNITAPGSTKPIDPPDPAAAITTAPEADESFQREPSLSDSIWWLARSVAALLVVTLPFLILGLAGFIAYGYSREHVAHWALRTIDSPGFMLSSLATTQNKSGIEADNQVRFLPRVLLAADEVSRSNRAFENIPSTEKLVANSAVYFRQLYILLSYSRDPRAKAALEKSLSLGETNQPSAISDELPSETLKSLLGHFDLSEKWISKLDRRFERDLYTASISPDLVPLIDQAQAKVAAVTYLPNTCPSFRPHIQARAIALLAVMRTEAARQTEQSYRWLREMTARIDAETDEAKRDAGYAYVAAALTNAGRVREMNEIFDRISSSRGKLLIARHALCWYARSTNTAPKYFSTIDTFSDLER